jgi:hypothetical protein
MKSFLLTCLLIFATIPVFSQQDKQVAKPLTPYVEVLAGGCVYNPFSFIAGVQRPLTNHLSISYDVHYWNTRYKDQYEGVLSKGKWTSVTPSVKLTYSTGKKEGTGFVAGVGLGYMFAKDRGTEQSYIEDKLTGSFIYNAEITTGKWDFNSLAPSFNFGIGFRVLRFPVSLQTIYYFAKTTDGWMAAAGGAGVKIGLKRYK